MSILNLFLRKRFWLLVILILTPVLILMRAPATWLIGAAQTAAPQLKVSGISGSLWRGKAAITVWEDRGYELPLGQLNWQLSPLSLFTLKPCLKINLNAGPQVIDANRVCVSLIGQQLTLKQVDVTLPMENISPLLQVDVSGRINGFVKSASLNQQGFEEADINLLWNQAQINGGSQWVPLGNLQMTGSENEQAGLATRWVTINDSQAQKQPIDIQLDVVLSKLFSGSPGFNVSGFINPGQTGRALTPMLQFIGERTSSGAYRIDINE